jgi:hypothetical protein
VNQPALVRIGSYKFKPELNDIIRAYFTSFLSLFTELSK